MERYCLLNPDAMVLADKDKHELLEKLREITLQNLEKEDFGGKDLALAAGMSYATLNRRLNDVSGLQINQFIRITRLRKALEVLVNENLSAAEASYRTGFGSPSYFNKCFHEHFGYSPGAVKCNPGLGQQLLSSADPCESGIHGKRWSFRPFYRDNIRRYALIIAGVTILLISLVTVYQRISGESKDLRLPPGIPEKSIAVLPISNFTGNPEMDYFVSGIHDALIGELGKIRDLLVTSRTSTLRFKDPEHSITEIANELGVHYLVEGSVVSSHDSLQIMVQLIEVFPREKHIWSNSYIQDWANLMGIYRDVTRQIAQHIHIEIKPLEEKLFATARTINPELYMAYARGVYHMSKLSDEGFTTGIKYMHDAIAIDSLDPLPYVGLARIYSNAGHASDAGPDAHMLAANYAMKALELDPNLAEAHAVLATHYLYHLWDFDRADMALGQALEINRNIALVRYTNGWYQFIKHKDQLAILEMKQAIRIDPLDPICTGYLGWLYLWMDLYDEAIEQALKTLEVNPDYPMGHYVLGASLAELGRYPEAIRAHQAGLEKSRAFLCGLGVTYARAGMHEAALGVAAEMEQTPNAWNAWGLSDIYATLGDMEKAMYWVDQAYVLRQDFIPWMARNPYYRPLHNEPRFWEIFAALNLPT